MKPLTKILVINAGSSSLKFELFAAAGCNKNLRSLFEGHFDNRGKPIKDYYKVVAQAAAQLISKKLIKNADEISAVGHRVVHGGEHYTKPVKITPAVIKTIKKLSHLAPLHNPPNLAGIAACKKLFPHAVQVAALDTAFHQTMPEKAYLYALPYSLYKKMHIRRYGFHGTSHQYVFEQARKKLGHAKTQRAVTCHLGNGCSIAAIRDGKVVDTSMGFTPLEGIPMGTRSGDIDPAIIFYLMEQGFSAHEISKMLNKSSGLLGISGISSDVRDLWLHYKRKSCAARHAPSCSAKRCGARRALELFAYRIAKYIAAYSASLGGLDCIVFTGGIGENAWYLRKWILAYLKHLPRKRVLVIPTDEEKKIAEETLKLL